MPSKESAPEKLFSPFQIALATLIGTVLAGFILICLNYVRQGDRKPARICIWIGILFTFLLVFIVLFLPERFPDLFIPIVSSILIYFIARFLQGSHLQSHISSGGLKASSWSATGISLLSSVAFFIILLAVALVIPDRFLPDHFLEDIDEPSFEGWVSNPEMHEEWAAEMIAEQELEDVAEKDRLKREKEIWSYSKDRLIMTATNVSDDDLSLFIKRIVALGDPMLIDAFQRLFNSSTSSHRYYAIQDGIKHYTKKKPISAKDIFFNNLYNLLLEDLQSDGFPMEYQMDCLWLLYPKRTTKELQQPSLFTISHKKSAQVIESITKYKVALPKEEIYKRIQACKVELDQNDDTGEYFAHLLINHALYKDMESEKLLRDNIPLPQIDKYESWLMAKALIELRGLGDLDEYVEHNYKDQLKRTFPFDQIDLLVRIFISVQVLDAEVCNGGFSQYFSNGYGYQIKDAMYGLNIIGCNDAYQVTRKVQLLFDNYGKPGDYSDSKQAKLYDTIKDTLDNLSGDYYASDKKVLSNLYLYFAEQMLTKAH